MIHASLHVTVRQFSKLHDAYVGCGLECSQWLVGRYPHHDPRAKRANESIEQIKGYLTRQNTARALRRSNTNGCRECTDQVRAKKLGKHQSTAPRARSGGRHQRSEDHQVLGVLGRSHRHQAEHRRKRSRMNNAPRNLCYVATVSASQSSAAFSRSPGFGSIWETGWDEPTGKLQGVKKLKKIIGNKKGIDNILVAKLMVVIVVVASVMVYAWSTGLLGTLLVQPNVGKEAITMDRSEERRVGNDTIDRST